MDPLEFEAQYLGTFAFERPPVVETTVVHWLDRDEDGWVYIGRDMAGGYFGNPYSARLYGRDGALEYYRRYFEKRIAEDEVFRLAIHGLRGRQLVCHCKPMACHGDVIAAYLNGLENL